MMKKQIIDELAKLKENVQGIPEFLLVTLLQFGLAPKEPVANQHYEFQTQHQHMALS